MSKRKLLLADDSVTIQKVVNLTFTDEGFEVFTVGSGTAAMNMIGSVKPDVVLADVHMPGLTGYEVCEKIREKPEFETLPVILLVGSFEPFDEAEAARVGANDFLTKPFQSIRQLVQKVASLLDHAQTNGQTATLASRETNAGNAAETATEISETAFPVAELDDMEVEDLTIETVSGEQLAASQAAEFEPEVETNLATEIDVDLAMADDSFENRVTAPLSFNDAEQANQSFAANQMPTETAESAILMADSSENPITDFEMNQPQNIFPESDDQPFGEMPESTRALDGSAQNFAANDANDVQPMNFTNADSAAASFTPVPTIDIAAFEIDFDDDSLLELDEEVETIEAAAADSQTDVQTVAPTAVEVMPAQNFDQDHGLMQPGASAMSNQNLPFSPELIDAIAQRVVERLSDKVIEKIAWEVVPDRFDLIVRKHIDGRER